MTRLSHAAFIHLLRTRGIFELPLSPAMLRELARHRGIFALPTQHGERGMVLLASLGIDLGVQETCLSLLAMHQRGEIELASVPIVETRASLQARGLALEVNQDSDTGVAAGPKMIFHAVAVEAEVARADSISNGRIGWLWTAREISPACTLDRLTIEGAMSPMKLTVSPYTADHAELLRQHHLHVQYRATCAAEWNRRSGIVALKSADDFEDRPYLLLRPTGERFLLFKNDCREEAVSEAAELIAGCGHQAVEPDPAWAGNRLTIHSGTGDWTLVELEW